MRLRPASRGCGPAVQEVAQAAAVVGQEAVDGDRARQPRSRSEADGVLRIYRQRVTLIERWLDLGPPAILPLGVLMLVPKVRHAA